MKKIAVPRDKFYRNKNNTPATSGLDQRQQTSDKELAGVWQKTPKQAPKGRD